MRTLLSILFVTVVSGCETKQPATTYWTEKAGLVVVHHVVGRTDNLEKLTRRQLNNDEIAAAGLPEGKYFKVAKTPDQFNPAATQRTPAKKAVLEKNDSLAKLSEQLRDLKEQVKTVEVQNQRLQDEMNAPESRKTAQEHLVEGQADEQPEVRLSQ